MLYTLTEEEFAKLKSDRLTMEGEIKKAEIEIGTNWRIRAAEARAIFSRTLVGELRDNPWSTYSPMDLKRAVLKAVDEFERVLEGRLE
jgi:hypothetical protein